MSVNTTHKIVVAFDKIQWRHWYSLFFFPVVALSTSQKINAIKVWQQENTFIVKFWRANDVITVSIIKIPRSDKNVSTEHLSVRSLRTVPVSRMFFLSEKPRIRREPKNRSCQSTTRHLRCHRHQRFSFFHQLLEFQALNVCYRGLDPLLDKHQSLPLIRLHSTRPMLYNQIGLFYSWWLVSDDFAHNILSWIRSLTIYSSTPLVAHHQQTC